MSLDPGVSCLVSFLRPHHGYFPHDMRRTQVPDGEFLCPKCKTEEAAAPPVTPSMRGKGGAIVGQSGGGGGGGLSCVKPNGPGVPGEHGHPATDASSGGGGGGAVVAAEGGEEKGTGIGVGVPGISMLATDGSTVDLTQIAM